MTTTGNFERYAEDFRALSGSFAGAPDWLQQVRGDALAQAEGAGFPTRRLEDWKYTHAGGFAFAKDHFRPAGPEPAQTLEAADVETLGLSVEGAHRLVFVDGHFAPQLSAVGELPEGVRLRSLSEVLAQDAGALQGRLQTIEPHEGGSAFFDALNLAFLQDGAWLEIGAEVSLDAPVHLLFVASGRQGEVAWHPRILIDAGARSSATVLESHVGPGGGRYWSNSRADVRIGDSGNLRHVRLFQESEGGSQLSHLRVTQEANSRYGGRSFALSGALVRCDVDLRFEGRDAVGHADALYVLGGKEQADFRVTADHAQPGCISEQVAKGVLGGHSVGVFNSKVVVREGAEHTDSQQQNKNLLLANTATANTRPQLEIYADDVKCAHGATVGRLDDQALFYLRARGIDEKVARGMLTHAFALELLERIEDDAVRSRTDALLASRLSDLLGQPVDTTPGEDAS